MSETRNRIADHINTHPGVHFNELVEVLDLAPGQVQYHIRRLAERNAVIPEHLYGRTHYYSPEYNEFERATLALVRRETARDILASLLEQGPSRPEPLAADLDVARSTLEWHLDHLVEQGLVEKHRDDRRHVTLSIAHPEAIERLLREVTPSLPERFIDRFTRLFDQLLEEA